MPGSRAQRYHTEFDHVSPPEYAYTKAALKRLDEIQFYDQLMTK